MTLSVVSKINGAGNVNDQFGVGGAVRFDTAIKAAAIGDDGSATLLRAAGADDDGVVERLNPSGMPDTSFGVGGRVALPTGVLGCNGPIDRRPRPVEIAVRPGGSVLVRGRVTVGEGASVKCGEVAFVQLRATAASTMPSPQAGPLTIVAGSPGPSSPSISAVTEGGGLIRYG